MPPSLPPFPAGPVRDALGLVRLLWLVERDGVDVDRMKTLTEAGRLLRLGLKMSLMRHESLGYRASLPRAIDGVNLLASLEWPADLAEVVRTAGDRVRAAAAEKREDERDARRKAADARR